MLSRIRNLLPTARNDQGFTVAEILAAATILLIAFMGLFTLITATTTMSVRAREKTAMTNAANSYLETVRNMDYSKIGMTSSSNPTGTLSSQSFNNQIVNGINITVVPTVTWVDDPTLSGTTDYKKVTLAITATVGTSGSQMSFSTSAIVGEHSGGVGSSEQTSTGGGPIIDFTSDDPADGSRVSGTVHLGAIAAASGTGVTLSSLHFYVDDIPMRSAETSPNPNQAIWSLNAATATNYFEWYTLATDESGNPFSVDGTHRVRLEIWDSHQISRSVVRNYLVDNSAPNAPTALTIALTNATVGSATWPLATDGADPADHYEVDAWQMSSGGTMVGQGSPWPVVTAPGALATPFITTPLSCYQFAVKSYGTLPSPYVSAFFPNGSTQSRPFYVSRPSITTATWTNVWTGKNKSLTVKNTNVITVDPPTFSTSSLTYILRRSPNRDMSSAVQVAGVGRTWTDAQPDKGITPNQFYYQVEVLVTPTGGSAVDLFSQIVGPNETASSPLTGSMLPGTW